MTFKKKLLIDFDGVLNEYNGNYDEKFIPPIKEGAKEFLECFSQDTYELKIFTTRNRLLVSKWLIKNGWMKLCQMSQTLRNRHIFT